MNIRAIIFDVYGTLLEVGPAPPGAEERWHSLHAEVFGCSSPMGLADFYAACDGAIARRHAEARARGISWPEVQWRSVVAEVLPALGRLASETQEDFLFRQMQASRSLRLGDGASQALRALRERQTILGLASNAQAHTRRELGMALDSAGLSLAWFEPDLCFWSYQHGFSKPDPHVFRILTARLETRGIAPSEILMVGDRPDNDLEPARAHGWQTWRLAAATQTGAAASGHWSDLLAWLSPAQ
jgi:FMN phosphatase YigB (HAD superfamily)